MKKMKDIFYNLNDVLVAFIIVAIAAFVIVSNIDSILNYPTSIAEKIQVPEEKTPTTYAENPPIDQSGDSDSDQTGTTGTAIDNADSSDENDSKNGEVVNYGVYINAGSTGEQIADILINVGLFKDRQEFNNAVAAAGAEGKLKAGNFVIPSDSTPAEVIAIITK